MRGYKGMESDMTCRGFQYEIGKEYHTDGKIKLCKKGFHFCKNLKYVFDFYEKNERNRFFEVEGNVVESDGVKYVADELHIVRELTAEEVNKCYYNDFRGEGYYGNYNGNGYGSGGYEDIDCGCGYGTIYGDGYGFGSFCDDSYNYYYYGDRNGNGRGSGSNNRYKYDERIEKVLKFI